MVQIYNFFYSNTDNLQLFFISNTDKMQKMRNSNTDNLQVFIGTNTDNLQAFISSWCFIRVICVQNTYEKVSKRN